MLAISSLRTDINDCQRQEESIPTDFSIGAEGDFPDFSDANLLDSIDFDDLFIGINDGDILPDLEMDMELLAEFSASGGEESEIMNVSSTISEDRKAAEDADDNYSKKEEDGQDKSGGSAQSGTSTLSRGEEVASSINESVVVNSIAPKETDMGIRKLSSQSKNNHSQGKRKVKVDWTPELHRRFVQAVEQLGVDKAVPSRILELMGIDCLTRHNIASHLQKYRSHRKHLLAREVEAANWSQRRQIYGTGAAAVVGSSKREASPWPAPTTATIGFPPVTPMPTHFRPLHVWGHPTIDQSMASMWSPKHMTHSPSPPLPPVAPAWATVAPHHPPPTLDAPYWPHPPRPMHVPNAMSPGTLCFTQTRFVAPPVPGVPPHPMYKVDPGFGHPVAPRPPFDLYPSKECVDAAIGDALSKPWLPLPLGLKPPSVDGVMGELQRQGIPKIPPSCS